MTTDLLIPLAALLVAVGFAAGVIIQDARRDRELAALRRSLAAERRTGLLEYAALQRAHAAEINRLQDDLDSAVHVITGYMEADL